MEMMIVLLIVSIVAATSAPMINKKIVGIASEKSPWVWTGESQNITYNADGKIRTASIGVVNPPKDYFPRLFIKTPNANNPHLSLQATNEAPLNFTWNKNAIGITNTKIANNTNVAEGSIAIGKEANTLNNYSINSIAIGTGANTAHANSANSIAIGRYANTTTGNEAIAIGNYARALMPQSVAIGPNAYVNEGNSSGLQKRAIAIGYNARATHSDSIAIGGKWGSYPTEASNVASIAIGSTAVASGEYSMAIGGKSSSSTTAEASSTTTRAGGSVSMALGMQANAAGNNSIALGHEANTSGGDESIAIGFRTKATGDSAIAIGSVCGTSIDNSTSTTASAGAAIAIGDGAAATSMQTIAIGKITRAIGDNSMAFGRNAYSRGSNSIAIGRDSYTHYSNTTAIGRNSNAYHANSTAIGYGAQTKTSNQIVLGRSTDTVYIPGHLVVGKWAYLNADDRSARTAVRPHAWNDKMYVLEKEYEDGHRFFMLGSGKTVCDGIVSDIRLKNVGKAFTAGLNEIKKLELFNYTFKKDPDKTPRVGVIAQDLQKVFPNAVFKADDGFLRIRTEDMFYALVNAVKELDAKIEALKNTEIATLKKQVQALEKENKAFYKQDSFQESCLIILSFRSGTK